MFYLTGTDRETEQGVFLDHNNSQRFESRFVTVHVWASPALMLHGMEDTVFGMWVSHGEGELQLSKSWHLRFKITYYLIQELNTHRGLIWVLSQRVGSYVQTLA